MFASFEIKADARSYAVRVDPGAAMDFLQAQDGDAIVICDAIFEERFAELGCPVLSLPALETHKTLEAAGRLVEAARAAGLTRKGRIVAVGGGMFFFFDCLLSEIYMRGVAWSYLPTTILGMVDSCIGGKSSINVGPFKNLVGTMHPPQMVLVDTAFARTLPVEHRAGGLCEAAKIAFARSSDVFTDYLALQADASMSDTALADVVVLSLKAKQWFIEIDEFDRKERLTLNFGHTFGHALESASNFAINHGAAVGLGMLCALDFAVARNLVRPSAQTEGLREQTRSLLDAVPDLARDFARVDMAEFERAFLSDKKHTTDRLMLVLPVRDQASDLPLSLYGLPRDADVLSGVCAAVERTQGLMLG